MSAINTGIERGEDASRLASWVMVEKWGNVEKDPAGTKEPAHIRQPSILFQLETISRSKLGLHYIQISIAALSPHDLYTTMLQQSMNGDL